MASPPPATLSWPPPSSWEARSCPSS
jgi:hypothetical protein